MLLRRILSWTACWFALTSCRWGFETIDAETFLDSGGGGGQTAGASAGGAAGSGSPGAGGASGSGSPGGSSPGGAPGGSNAGGSASETGGLPSFAGEGGLAPCGYEDCTVDLPVTSGLVLWLDGSDPSTFSTDGTVSQWDDKSGLGNHVRQAEPTRQPVSVSDGLGGRRVMRFDGVDDCLEAPNDGTFDGDVITIVLILANRTDDSAPGNASPFAIRGTHGGQTRLSLHMNDGNASFGIFNSIGADSTDFPLTKGEFFYLDVERVDGNFAHFIDGELIKSGTQALGSEFLNPVRIGAAEDDYEHFNGDIAEVIVFDRVLATDERADMNAYVETKWGIEASP